jgi:hypothetical protein
MAVERLTVAEPNDEREREEREIKVTDKRMFTADGELKEEFRQTAVRQEEPDRTAEEPQAARPAVEAPARAAAPPVEAPPAERPEAPAAGGGPRARVEMPGEPGMPTPTFIDVISVLAEPATIYLGDVELPDGSSAEDLDTARLYIDLLDVVRKKTAGNLTAQESGLLEDVLYRLRMRYVQKRG